MRKRASTGTFDVFFAILLVAAGVFMCIYVLLPTLGRERFEDNNPSNADDRVEDVLDRAPMFIINLDRRPDRLKLTMSLLAEQGFEPVTRLRAKDGDQIWEHAKHLVAPDSIAPIVEGVRSDERQLTRGAVGCFLSHVGVWRSLALDENGAPACIVFEDDTMPTMSFQYIKETIAPDVPDDWDILLFGAVMYSPCKAVNQRICRVRRFVCLHAYMIRKRAAEYLASRAFPMSQQLDWWLSDLAEKGEINVYVIRGSRWHQNDAIHDSNIQNKIIRDGDEDE